MNTLPGCVLPSATSACELAHGVPGALPRVVLHTLGRALLIGTGLFLAGERKRVVRYSFAVALAIEAFAISWAMYQKNKERQP
jgi:hypothetical protein